MGSLEDKLKDLKKKSEIKIKTEFFKQVFEDGFIDVEFSIKEKEKNEFNKVISLIENQKLDFYYRLKPSIILNIDNFNNSVESSFYHEIINFFSLEVLLLLLFGYVYNYDQYIEGFVKIKKETLAKKIHKYFPENGFIFDENRRKFFYYRYSENSKYIYIYKGVVDNEKFIRIIY